MIEPLLITALSAGVPSLCWMIVRWRACAVTQHLTEKALQGAPATQRAGILRASAELADKLSAERTARWPVMLPIGRRSGRAEELRLADRRPRSMTPTPPCFAPDDVLMSTSAKRHHGLRRLVDLPVNLPRVAQAFSK